MAHVRASEQGVQIPNKKRKAEELSLVLTTESNYNYKVGDAVWISYKETSTDEPLLTPILITGIPTFASSGMVGGSGERSSGSSLSIASTSSRVRNGAASTSGENMRLAPDGAGRGSPGRWEEDSEASRNFRSCSSEANAHR